LHQELYVLVTQIPNGCSTACWGIFGLAFAPIYIAATDSSQIAYRQFLFFFGAGYAIVKEELE
jgi:hypothetical protein